MRSFTSKSTKKPNKLPGRYLVKHNHPNRAERRKQEEELRKVGKSGKIKNPRPNIEK